MNNNVMTVKPVRLYKPRNLSFADIKEGDIIPAYATSLDFNEGIIKCNISFNVPNAFIAKENFSFPELPRNFDEENIPGAIKGLIGKMIVAKVIRKFDDGTIELDRKIVMKDTVEYLSNNIGNTVLATVESIYSYGAFIDLGNGVISLKHISEFSKCKYYDLENLVRVGEQIKVKLMSFDKDTSRFTVSRKEAYQTQLLTLGSFQRVRVFEEVPGGAYVEFDPATIGIMDVPYYVKYGEYAMCYIKRNTEKGFKANFISRYNEK